MVEIQEEFKYRLDKALAIRGMKPKELSVKTGISESAISQYRSGLTKPKDKRLVKIANALSVNPTWLLGLDVPMEVEKEQLTTEELSFLIKSGDIETLIETIYPKDKADAMQIATAYLKCGATEKNIIRRILGLEER